MGKIFNFSPAREKIFFGSIFAYGNCISMENQQNICLNSFFILFSLSIGSNVLGFVVQINVSDSYGCVEDIHAKQKVKNLILSRDTYRKLDSFTQFYKANCNVTVAVTYPSFATTLYLEGKQILEVFKQRVRSYRKAFFQS